MKKSIIYFTIATFLIPFALSAQEKKEEHVGFESATFYADSIQIMTLNFAKRSAYYLNLLPDKISMAKAEFGYQKGHYIPSQGATADRYGQLYTEGSTRLGSVKLFGSFKYQKSYEDSTRFAHQTRNNLTTPYYFGSPGYVHYERGLYNFAAMASKSILKEKIIFGLDADYLVANHFSTNDPRGAIGEYQLDVAASVAFKFSPIFKVGIGYRPGYGREDINVAYKNPRYYESSVFPMYYNHLINGYGEGRPVLSGLDRKYFNNFKRNGLDVYLDMTSVALGSFSFYGNYTKETQTYFQTSDSGFKYFSNYDLEKIKAALLWLRPLNTNHKIGINLDFEKLDGADQNLEFKANNYIYASQEIKAKIFLNKKTSSSSYNYYLNASQYQQERIDGIRANDLAYNNLLIEIGSGFRHQQLKNRFIGINLAIQYKMPINDTFRVAQANEGYFTRYVIYHDYLFNTSSYLGGSLSGEYSLPVFKTMQASFKINAGYMRKLEQQNLNRTIISEPGKDRFSSNISLNLYF